MMKDKIGVNQRAIIKVSNTTLNKLKVIKVNKNLKNINDTILLLIKSSK